MTKRTPAPHPESENLFFGQVFIASRHNRSLLGAGTLRGNRLLPFLVALILLAFALGSLTKSQPGGSLLLNSYWLIYILSLAPVIGMGLIIVMIIFLIYNWRLLSDALGHGIARKRSQQKKGKSKTLTIIIWMAAWALAIVVLTSRCGGFICRATPDLNVTSQFTGPVLGAGTTSTLPLLGTVAQLSNLAQSNWFYFAILGLIIVSCVIVVRGIKVSWQETKADLITQIPLPRPEGIEAVEDAIHILKNETTLDPRIRIINSYQSMIQRAQGVGTRITSDQTARELEAAIRNMLGVNSPAIKELTSLFEEARYSLHPITEDDAGRAQRCLLDISGQMDLRLNVLKIET